MLKGNYCGLSGSFPKWFECSECKILISSHTMNFWMSDLIKLKCLKSEILSTCRVCWPLLNLPRFSLRSLIIPILHLVHFNSQKCKITGTGLHFMTEMESNFNKLSFYPLSQIVLFNKKAGVIASVFYIYYFRRRESFQGSKCKSYTDSVTMQTSTHISLSYKGAANALILQ